MVLRERGLRATNRFRQTVVGNCRYQQGIGIESRPVYTAVVFLELWRVDATSVKIGEIAPRCVSQRPIEFNDSVVRGNGAAGCIFDSNSQEFAAVVVCIQAIRCLLYTSPSPRDRTRSRMPSSA